jgi:hypothetical protein
LFSSKDCQLKFWSMASQSCFYTISENVTEVYTFALLKDDRLLVVGSGEIELMVFELAWLGRHIEEVPLSPVHIDKEEEEKLTKKARKTDEAEEQDNKEVGYLVGGAFIPEQSDQANVSGLNGQKGLRVC